MTKETDMDNILTKVDSMKSFVKDETIMTEEIDSQPHSVGFCGKPVSLTDAEPEDGKILTFGQGFNQTYKLEITEKKQRNGTQSHDGGWKLSSQKGSVVSFKPQVNVLVGNEEEQVIKLTNQVMSSIDMS